MRIFLVEGYGGELESAFITVVAEDELGAEERARERLDSVAYPYLTVDEIKEVDGYRIIVGERIK